MACLQASCLDWWERLQASCRFGRPRYAIDIEVRDVGGNSVVAIFDRKDHTVKLHNWKDGT